MAIKIHETMACPRESCKAKEPSVKETAVPLTSARPSLAPSTTGLMSFSASATSAVQAALAVGIAGLHTQTRFSLDHSINIG